MRVSDVLRAKGSVVATVAPDTTVTAVLALMAEQRVGAVVVVDSGTVAGMIWERDVIHHLHERGAVLLDGVAADIMNGDVISCVLRDEVDGILQTMTERRIRHLPVVIDTELSGIVSMGDLVKAKIDQLETERAHLQSYIAT